MAKAIMKNFSFYYDPSPGCLYTDNGAYATVMAPPTMTIATEFEVIPDEDGVICKAIDEKEVNMHE